MLGDNSPPATSVQTMNRPASLHTGTMTDEPERGSCGALSAIVVYFMRSLAGRSSTARCQCSKTPFFQRVSFGGPGHGVTRLQVRPAAAVRFSRRRFLRLSPTSAFHRGARWRKRELSLVAHQADQRSQIRRRIGEATVNARFVLPYAPQLPIVSFPVKPT